MFEPNENIKHFLEWIDTRHNVFLNKQAGHNPPWTENEIIANHKFTNVFRFLDWESQYLIGNVINVKGNLSVRDVITRILLFKIFNLSTTWEYLENRLGQITYDTDLSDINAVLDEYVEEGGRVFSSAYLSASYFVQKEEWAYLVGEPKHFQYLTVMGSGILAPDSIDRFYNTNSVEELFNVLSEYDGMGPFMSYQYAQDLNYSKWFNHDMNQFVKEGPGSIRGVKRCFDGVTNTNVAEIIKWTYDNIDDLFNQFYPQGSVPFVGAHRITLPDIQNCFCESDKYMRGLGLKVDGVAGKAIKQKYDANKSRTIHEIAFPKLWVGTR